MVPRVGSRTTKTNGGADEAHSRVSFRDRGWVLQGTVSCLWQLLVEVPPCRLLLKG